MKNCKMHICIKSFTGLTIMVVIGCIYGLILINNFKKEKASQTSCGDICGLYFIQYSGLCCDSYSSENCKLKQTCKKEINSRYAGLEFGLWILLILSLFWVLGYVICQCLPKKKKRYLRRNPGPNYAAAPQNPYQPLNLNTSDRLQEPFIVRDCQNTCAVCYEAYGIDNVIHLNCGHACHGKCFRSGLNKQDNCPLCRIKI